MDFETCLSAGVDGSFRVVQGFTVYAPRRDKALSISGGIFGETPVPHDTWVSARGTPRAAPRRPGHVPSVPYGGIT